MRRRYVDHVPRVEHSRHHKLAFVPAKVPVSAATIDGRRRSVVPPQSSSAMIGAMRWSTLAVPGETRIVAIILLATMALAACAGGTPTSAQPLSEGSGGSSAMVSASELPPSPTPSRSEAVGGSLAHDSVAQVVTTDLVVRSEPGVHAGSEIYPARLNEPMLLYVVDGPVRADGFGWYLVQAFAEAECMDVCREPPPFGWVAQAGSDREVWVAPASVSCPDITVDEIQWVPLPGRLACFGGETLQFEGQFGPCFNEKMGGIVYAAGCLLSAPGWEPGTGIRPTGITLRFDQVTVVAKDGSLTGLPASAPLVRVTGQFDHAKAADCGRDQYPLWQLGPEEDPLQPIDLGTAQQRVLHCRSEFVVSEVRLLE